MTATSLFMDDPEPAESGKVVDFQVGTGRRARAAKKNELPSYAGQTYRQQDLDLFHQSLDIDETSTIEARSMGFMATAMVYASLPYRKVEGAVYKRKNNQVSLTILNDPDIGIPYGKTPRVITAFLCTEAIRTKSRELSIGKDFKAFAAKLGMSDQGGARGQGTALKAQALRLFTSRISIIHENERRLDFNNLNIADAGSINLWNPISYNREDKAPWESKLLLSEQFFDNCLQHSCPIDLRVLHMLESPLAIDIYIWLTYRYNSINGPIYISWESLKWQFGVEYANTEEGLNNFRKKFKIQLMTVKSIYRDANFRFDNKNDCLVLLPSRPHVKQVVSLT